MDTTRYAVIWFEGPDKFTMVDRKGRITTMSESQARNSPSITGVLYTQADVEEAQEDCKYAISVQLLEDLFGCDVD